MWMWNESNAQLNKGFPEEIQAALKVGMSDPNVSGPAMKAFRQRHGCRLDQFPYEYNYTLDRLFSKDGDTTVTRAMCVLSILLSLRSSIWLGSVDPSKIGM